MVWTIRESCEQREVPTGESILHPPPAPMIGRVDVRHPVTVVEVHVQKLGFPVPIEIDKRVDTVFNRPEVATCRKWHRSSGPIERDRHETTAWRKAVRTGVGKDDSIDDTISIEIALQENGRSRTGSRQEVDGPAPFLFVETAEG